MWRVFNDVSVRIEYINLFGPVSQPSAIPAQPILSKWIIFIDHFSSESRFGNSQKAEMTALHTPWRYVTWHNVAKIESGSASELVRSIYLWDPALVVDEKLSKRPRRCRGRPPTSWDSVSHAWFFLLFLSRLRCAGRALCSYGVIRYTLYIYIYIYIYICI